MKIYTRTGDDGTTGLFGGPRISKYDLRIEAYGTVDELNATVGLVRTNPLEGLDPVLEAIQEELFELGADLATPLDAGVRVARVSPERSTELERRIDCLEADLAPLQSFILPGGSTAAAQLHVARTVCRRAERLVVRLAAENGTHPEVITYLNRLSDFLFVAARWANHAAGESDVTWTP